MHLSKHLFRDVGIFTTYLAPPEDIIRNMTKLQQYLSKKLYKKQMIKEPDDHKTWVFTVSDAVLIIFRNLYVLYWKHKWMWLWSTPFMLFLNFRLQNTIPVVLHMVVLMQPLKKWMSLLESITMICRNFLQSDVWNNFPQSRVSCLLEWVKRRNFTSDLVIAQFKASSPSSLSCVLIYH